MRKTPGPSQLERVVNRRGHVIGLPNDGEALVGPQVIRVDARVGLQGARRQLVDVALLLQMQSATTDIGNRHYRFQYRLALQRQVPVPRLGVFEGLALRGECQREQVLRAAAGIIHAAQRH